MPENVTTMEVDVDTLAAALDEGAPLVDVREPLEYAEARVPGATLLPLSQLQERVSEIDATRRTYVICRSGHRSAVVCEALASHGYDVVNVAGGTIAWIRAGYPFDQGD